MSKRGGDACLDPPAARRVRHEGSALPARFFGVDRLEQPPSHISAGNFDALAGTAAKKSSAASTVQYYTGAEQPWVDANGSPITDPVAIANEEAHKATVEAEDAAAGVDGMFLRKRGVRVDYLFAITVALDLWDWKTWEVVQFLVKPTTEQFGRCRFADLPAIAPFTGLATVFMSHTWGGRFGDLVAAACKGARTNRIVWIDIFAVSEWMDGWMWKYMPFHFFTHRICPHQN